MMQLEIKELLLHAAKLVGEGKEMEGAFEQKVYIGMNQPLYWRPWGYDGIPDFNNGGEWRIAKPKKQLIDWSHPMFKGCATNYGGLVAFWKSDNVFADNGNTVATKCLRLATPANEDSNWQYFRSTPENCAKLRELAKMVKVEVRVAYSDGEGFEVIDYADDRTALFPYTHESICNYRITGECQDGRTDNPKEAV